MKGKVQIVITSQNCLVLTLQPARKMIAMIKTLFIPTSTTEDRALCKENGKRPKRGETGKTHTLGWSKDDYNDLTKDDYIS